MMTDEYLFAQPEHQQAKKVRKPRVMKTTDVPVEGKVILDRINNRRVVCIHELKETYPKLDVAEIEALCVFLHHQGAIRWFGGEWYGALDVPGDSPMIGSAYRKRQASIANKALDRA